MIKDFDKTAIISGERHVAYSQMLQKITLFSEHTPKQKDYHATLPVQERHKVVIFSENREGYIYAFFAVWNNRAIAVPVDAMSTADELAYVLKDCQPSAVWTTMDRLSTTYEALDKIDSHILVDVIDNYEKLTIPDNTPKAKIKYEMEDTALIIYTSGTTGSPKGVMLSFKNLFTNIRSVSEEVSIYRPNRRALILLPLHHVLPLQGTMIAPIVLGAGVAIAPSMSAADIMKTLQDGKVGLFIGVPRLWQALYDGIMKKINESAVARTMYKLCDNVNNPRFSRFVFKKIHKMMGGHLEACPSGGAALDPETWQGLHTLGLEIIEGYGMTECAPIITFSRPDDLRPGCVGKALPSCKVEIIDGEICAKGDNIMQGYYNRPEETAAVIDKAGWLHSGDLGYMDKEGRLYITGRKKEIIVLSNGKNINPGELESRLERDSERVKEAAVIEENDKLKAIICPQPSWMSGKTFDEIEQSLKHDVIEEFNKVETSYKKLSGLYVYDGELPRTRMDKIQRFKLSSIVDACRKNSKNVTEIIEKGPKSKEYQCISDYISKSKHLTVHPKDNLTTDLAFDSLDIVSFQYFLEQTFGMDISQQKILSYNTISDLAEYITKNKTRIWLDEVNWRKRLTEDNGVIDMPKMAWTGWRLLSDSRRMTQHYFKMKLNGLENIPKTGQFILVSNHQSFIDTLFLVQGLSKEQFNNMCFFAKEEHVKTPLVKFLARHHGVIVLEKNRLKDSIVNLSRAIKAGANIMIFPEGTRTTNGKVNEFKPTFAILSMALNVPVLPVCIKGAFEVLPKHQKIPSRKPVEVTYLPPISPMVFKSEKDMTAKVKQCISELLNTKE